VAIALVDFFRWHAVVAKRISFGPVTPMAPATEWLFAMLGVAFGLYLFFPVRPIARRIAAVLSVLAMLAALHVILCHLNDRVPKWESWLGFGGMEVEGFSVGYISTQSAVLSLCSNFALIALLSPLAGRARWRDAGIFTALAVELFALVTVVSYAAGNPPVSNDGWLKVAPLVMFEFALFNLLLLIGGRATSRLRQWFFGTDPSAPDFAPVPREEGLVFGLLAGVGLMALTASVVYLRVETQNYQTRSIEALQSMSDLKVYQIEQWRRERFGDARALMRTPFLAEAVRSLSNESTADTARSELTGWLRVFVQEYGYARAVVLNRAMEPILTEPGQPDLSASGLRERLRTLRPDSDVMELPPYLDGAGILHWDLLVPLRTFQSTTLEGVILLQTDPTRSVIQVLQSWRAEYQTGQSMLWYREGDRLISLGGYRPVPGTTPDELRPLGMIRSLSDPTQSQSMLTRVARGELSMGEGLDHRGVMIVGFGRPIANSPWLLSSRVDSTEVYAPLRRNAIGVASATAGLLASMGFVTSWLWRQRQKNLLHERFTAEMEQKRLAARLGMVMRHAKDIIIVTDGEMRFVDVNQQAVDTYGWTKEEMLRLTIWDIRAPGTLKALPGDIERIKSEAGAIFETIHRRKDHTTFPVESSVRRVEIDGQPHLLSIVRDISERRAHEVRIEQLGRLYRVLSQINEVIFRATDKAELLNLVCQTLVESGQFKLAWVRWHNPETRTLESLAAYGNRSGHSVVVTTEQQPEGLGPSGTAFRENRTYVCNDFFADPSTAPWREPAQANDIRSSIAIPIRQGGAAVAVLGVYADKKDCFGNEETALLEKAAANLSFALDTLAAKEQRAVSDAALQASEERYRLIADNTADVIWLYDLDRECFTYTSPSVFKLSGFMPEEVMGRDISEVLTPESAHSVMTQLPALLEAIERGEEVKRTFTIEVGRKHRDGHIVPTEVVATLVAGRDGRFNRILGVTRDISERKRTSEALRLEAETKSLLEKEREVSEMKTRFISVASHEFRTPMAAAMGSVELLAHHLDRLPPTKRQELFDRIVASFDRMTAMLDDVLTLSRMEAGRTEVRPAPCELRTFLLGLVDEIRLSDRDAHQFECLSGSDPIPMTTDISLLHHVLSNLLGNAVRYSLAGTRITLRCEPNPAEVRISIEDQGLGIPEKDRKRIFEAFERGSNVGQIKGTGLGLNIVKSMTELLGGTITVESTEGRGSCFILAFPRHLESHPRP
jgi:PAS domain S-box-containing protein